MRTGRDTPGSTPQKGVLCFAAPGVSFPSCSLKPESSRRARQSPQVRRQSTFACWLPSSSSTCPTQAGFPESQMQTLPKQLPGPAL